MSTSPSQVGTILKRSAGWLLFVNIVLLNTIDTRQISISTITRDNIQYIAINEFADHYNLKYRFYESNFIKDNYDSYPITIDSDDILKNPKEKIKKLCTKLNIKFTERMINWPKGKRESDGIWSIVWYEQVNNSSTFQNYTENNLEIPKKYNGIYEESLEIYNQMKQFSL